MTKTAGVLYFIVAAVVLAVIIGNFAGQFAAAGDVVSQFKEQDLSTTDLRWSMGVQFLVDLVVVAAIAIVGWFLFGSETEQYAYVIATGLLLIGALTIRLTPLVPITAARLSPTVFFYGTQVRVTFTADDTRAYVTLPQSDQFLVGRMGENLPEKQAHVLLDFHGSSELKQAYWYGQWPATIIGSVSGTRTLVNRTQARNCFLVPRVKVYKVETAAGAAG
jgi:hypothetical protein